MRRLTWVRVTVHTASSTAAWSLTLLSYFSHISLWVLLSRERERLFNRAWRKRNTMSFLEGLYPNWWNSIYPVTLCAASFFFFLRVFERTASLPTRPGLYSLSIVPRIHVALTVKGSCLNPPYYYYVLCVGGPVMVRFLALWKTEKTRSRWHGSRLLSPSRLEDLRV